MRNEQAYGIPTPYNGVRYRSRLEARWAAFMDWMGWSFEYEPCDFLGWIPDFLVWLPNDSGTVLPWHRVYVEVKPILGFSDDIAAKINASGCRDKVLLVGESFSNDDNERLVLGHVRSWFFSSGGYPPEGFEPDPYRWRPAYVCETERQGKLSFCSQEFVLPDGHEWTDHLTGQDHNFRPWHSSLAQAVLIGWHQAGNIVRWRPHS